MLERARHAWLSCGSPCVAPSCWLAKRQLGPWGGTTRICRRGTSEACAPPTPVAEPTNHCQEGRGSGLNAPKPNGLEPAGGLARASHRPLQQHRKGGLGLTGAERGAIADSCWDGGQPGLSARSASSKAAQRAPHSSLLNGGATVSKKGAHESPQRSHAAQRAWELSTSLPGTRRPCSPFIQARGAAGEATGLPGVALAKTGAMVCCAAVLALPPLGAPPPTGGGHACARQPTHT